MESGTKLGHYTVSSLIGKGGMGEVYQARDETLGRQVAIKVLPEEFAEDTDRVARFRREAQLLASLNHPNIAAIHGLDETDGKHFLVLELVEGPTLADRIRQGAIPVQESLNLALQIAAALEAAHEKGVIHRDLKPANIKVTPEGKVKVLDFGLAKAFEADQADVSVSNSPTLSMAATEQGIILGTAAYMSPEQASGTPTDKRADIWSFGVVLFEMLTARPVFVGETVSHVLAAVLAKDPPWDSLPASLHPRLRELLERCLEKDSNNRWHDVADVRIDIQKVLADPKGLSTQPIVTVSGAAPRSKLRWVAVGFLLGIVIAGTAAWNLKPDPVLAINRFSHVLAEDQAFTRVGRPLVAVSPDGSRMVYVANGELYLRAMDTLESTAIPGTDEDPSGPFFSPDGQWIGYWSGSTSQLKKIAVSGGAAVTLSVAQNPYGASFWGADDTIVWGQAEGIMGVSANGGVPEVLIAGDGNLVHPQILPDGESVLLHVGGVLGAGEVTVVSLDSGERKALFPGSQPRYVPTGHIVYGTGDVLFAVPFDLASLEVTGGPVPVIEGIQASPLQYALSDSGSIAYVPGAGEAEASRTLALVDRTGRVERLGVRPAPYVMPSVSPDGSRIAVQTLNSNGTGAIWIYDLSGETQIRQLTQEGNNVRPVWTPDGERITFASDREGPRSIYWQAADGRGLPERLTTTEEGTVDAPHSWSGDGRHLSFVRVTGGNTAVATTGGRPFLWTVSLDSDAGPQIIHDSVTASSAFSPNGQWIAYGANDTGRLEVYVEPFPPTGLIHQITQEGGNEPEWSSDGEELFFVTPDGQLVAVDIRTEGSFAFGTERPLLVERFFTQVTYKNYDVTPDGQRFLVVLPLDGSGPGEPGRPQINIITNWFEDLRARVPVR